VQRVGIGPYGTVLHQSIFCERASALGLLAASPRLLKLTDEIAARQPHALKQRDTGKLLPSELIPISPRASWWGSPTRSSP
jgi:hypothetical protein